eukprot:3399444-Pyramimonas_sp.AAC.1
MVSIATGGFWTKARSVDANLCASDICERCKTSRETALHRCWTCAENDSTPAYAQSAHLLPEAVASSEAYPCFWMRGLSPAHWTAVTPPPSIESWDGNGLLNEGLVGPACLAEGTPEEPLNSVRGCLWRGRHSRQPHP